MIKNILSNYFGKVINIGSAIIFIPIYIEILNIEAYGIITFYTVLLSILFFADAGLSGTLNRELAKNESKTYKANLVYSFEVLFTGISILIFIIVGLSSGLIAHNFLNTELFSQKELALYITLMGGCIALQLFTSIENSGLLGLEKQVEANILQSSGSLLRSGFVIVPLYFYPTLTTFFVWQVISNILIFYLTRLRLWNQIRIEIKPKLDFKILKSISGFTLGLFGLAVFSAINTQIDKITITKLLTLKEFAHYSLGSIVAQVPLMVITPISVAFLPRIIKLSEKGKENRLKELYRFESYLIAGIASLATVVLVVYLREILTLWLTDENIIEEILKFGEILIIANFFLALQITPYHLGIAHGHTKTNLNLSTTLLLLIIPVMIWAVKNFGLKGAAWTWLGYNFIAWIVLTFLLNRRFIHDNKLIDWITGILLPIFLNVGIGMIFYYFKSSPFSTFWLDMILLCFQTIISIIIIRLIHKIILDKNFKN